MKMYKNNNNESFEFEAQFQTWYVINIISNNFSTKYINICIIPTLFAKKIFVNS